MRCSKCGSDNREGRKFCAKCGSPLARLCPKCGASNEPGEDFCGECGTALGDADQQPPTHTAPVTAFASGERRHLTVLFCDLVGSTEIIAQLDPEEWREIVAAYHRGAAGAITRFGGYVGQYLGDGVMAYFGWPEAHDNDGERAARAGLAILEAITKLNAETTSLRNGGGSGRPQLAARVGIDSGAVVVGAGVGKDADVFGETANIAARLQATATPGTALITAATHRLISGLFVVEALGPRPLKGIATPPEVFRVVRPTGVRGRLAAARGLTPFVGREEELRLLLSRWERARESEGQVALIIGEPGIGKSRLVAEFHDRIRDAPHIWLESGGEQVFENTPFYAISEMLSRWRALQDAANTEEQLQQLERVLTAAGLNAAEIVPLIAELLQLPAAERYPATALTAEQKRRRLLAALSGWVLAAARLQPLVMVVEDLHWLDPSTLELLQLLGEQGATVPLMLLYTTRPEFRAPWTMRTHHNQITLNHLSARNVREMIALVAARNGLASESMEAVIERTGGVPLFVEELTRAVLESGGRRGTGREIPATLHDSLMARLDRLGAAKEVIQIGAVIGSEFSYELLHTIYPLSDYDLQSAIRTATDAELVFVRGIPPQATYQFKHALIRDAAYEALLKSRRKELHSRIAEVLARRFPESVTSAPELLAHHYTEAGLFTKAILYWQQAGQRSAQRSAYAEAIAHLTKGLELIRVMPATRERAQQELMLQVALGVPLQATKGYAAPEVQTLYAHARELCQQVGETPQLFPVTLGLWVFFLVRAEYQTARELGEQLIRLAQKINDPPLLLDAHSALGQTLCWQGEFAPARAHLERGLAYYTPQQHDPQAFLYGLNPKAVCLSYTAFVLWHLGYPDQALHKINQAFILTQELSHPFSLVFVLVASMVLHQLRREVQLARERAEAVIAQGGERGFPQFLAWGTVWRGWALAQQEQGAEGIARIRGGIAAYQATEGGAMWPYCLALLAEAHGHVGQAEEGLSVLTEALTILDRTGEGFYEAEVYRLKGELLLMQKDNAAKVATCFQRAIDIARKQDAKSCELRATTSLARLFAHLGHRDEARTTLTEIYVWFTEGFDTADLKEAKALLDELSR